MGRRQSLPFFLPAGHGHAFEEGELNRAAVDKQFHLAGLQIEDRIAPGVQRIEREQFHGHRNLFL